MPTVTRGAGAGTNVWSDTTAWSTGVLPAAGETVNLATYVVAIDVARIPASGSLAGIIASGVGGMTLALNSYACTIDCGTGTILPGTITTYFLNVTGTTTNILNIIANITGGAIGGAFNIYHNSTGTLNITGNILGGSGTYGCMAVANKLTGAINITGNITGGSISSNVGFQNYLTGSVSITNGNLTGGSAALAYAVHSASTGNITLNNVNIINSTYALGYSGKPPVTWNMAANDNYIQFGSVKFGPEPLDHQLLAGVKCGDITGNRTDCSAAQAVEAASYGDPASPTTGTYHEAAEAEVESGVTFGPTSTYTGTLAAGGGGGGARIVNIGIGVN